MKDWQKVLIRFAGIAAGVTVALAGISVSIYWYASRPKAWNTHALVVKHAKAEPLLQMNDKLEEIGSGTTFTVDVENTTGDDISLPQTITIMEQSKTSHALHRSFLKLNREYFLPARYVTSISLDDSDLCAANDLPQSCFDRYYKEEGVIVLFDEPQKLEILIPVPSLTLPPGQVKSSPETPAPPCKDGAANCEPWQREWNGVNLKPGSVVTDKGTILPPSGR